MRVVAGTLKGRRLRAPAGRSTRPTSELVRAAICNSLTAQGLLEDAVVADLFAGSGALGIEALSRGAKHVTFVEHDRTAVRVLAANLAALDLDDRSRIVGTTVERWVAAGPEPPALILADPPYDWRSWDTLLSAAVRFPKVVVMAEAAEPITALGWDVVGIHRHGGTVVSQLQPTPGAHRP